MNISRIAPQFNVFPAAATSRTFSLPEIPGKAVELHRLNVAVADSTTPIRGALWLIEFGLSHNLAATARASRDDATWVVFHEDVDIMTAVGGQRYPFSWHIPLDGVLVGGSQRFHIFFQAADEHLFRVIIWWRFRDMPETEWRRLHQQTVIGAGGLQTTD